VPLSTFNFSGKVPSGPGGRVWLCTLLLTGGVLLFLEVYLRSQGQVPTIMDDQSLWSQWRQQIGGQSNVVAFLGSSRMQLAISPEAWRGIFPGHKVVQLAFDAGSPVPVLEDLAGDTEFCGTVICDIIEYRIVRSSYYEERGADFVKYYHKRWNVQKYLDRILRTALTENSVVLSPGRDWKGAARDLLRARIPQMKPYYLRTLSDRSRQADYQLADVERQRKNWLDDLTQVQPGQALRTNGEWQEAIHRIQTAARRIEARGGRVIFVRFPTSGELRVLENKLYPRREFWDEFVRDVGAPAIHFEDVPALSRFTCPDGSHLDQRDAAPFTRALAEEMQRRGLL
jgi:hypothetical protein